MSVFYLLADERATKILDVQAKLEITNILNILTRPYFIHFLIIFNGLKNFFVKFKPLKILCFGGPQELLKQKNLQKINGLTLGNIGTSNCKPYISSENVSFMFYRY